MTASHPLVKSNSSLECLENWPGVPDERLADAELDTANGYEMFKNQTACHET